MISICRRTRKRSKMRMLFWWGHHTGFQRQNIHYSCSWWWYGCWKQCRILTTLLLLNLVLFLIHFLVKLWRTIMIMIAINNSPKNATCRTIWKVICMLGSRWGSFEYNARCFLIIVRAKRPWFFSFYSTLSLKEQKSVRRFTAVSSVWCDFCSSGRRTILARTKVQNVVNLASVNTSLTSTSWSSSSLYFSLLSCRSLLLLSNVVSTSTSILTSVNEELLQYCWFSISTPAVVCKKENNIFETNKVITACVRRSSRSKFLCNHI